MDLETFARLLIYLHAGTGALALAAGTVALFSRKGLKLHRKAGKIFFYAMLISAGLALVVAMLPGHQSPFLFSIGIFSLYFIITGYRALQYRLKTTLLFDKVFSWLMAITGLAMILLPLIIHQTFNIILTVFGLVGLLFSTRDLYFYQKVVSLRKKWLRLHLSKMTAGYIAAATAFVVVNNVFPGITGWFIPGIIGSIYIFFQVRKIKPRPLPRSV
jgi:uncharacterized membrane protein